MSIVIPFELWQDSAIVLKLAVNGVAATALLDSGATLTLIDRGFREALNLRLAGPDYNVQTPTGSTRARGTETLQLTFGGAPLCTTQAAAYDLSPMTKAYGDSIQLLLGRDFFETFVIEIDTRRRLLELTLGDDFDATTLPEPLPLARGARAERAVAISIEGGDEVLAILDLGSSSPVMLGRAYADAADLVRDKPTSTAATATVDGVSISTTFSLVDVAIGGLTFANVPAEAFANWRSSEFPVSIGFPLMARCRAVLDFGGDQVWLIDNGDSGRDDFERDRSGLGLAFEDDTLIVKHVATGGPAEQAGWREGERIVAINGQALDAGFRSSKLAQWRKAAAGMQFSLQMSDGSIRELVLCDHY